MLLLDQRNHPSSAGFGMNRARRVTKRGINSSINIKRYWPFIHLVAFFSLNVPVKSIRPSISDEIPILDDAFFYSYGSVPPPYSICCKRHWRRQSWYGIGLARSWRKLSQSSEETLSFPLYSTRYHMWTLILP